MNRRGLVLLGLLGAGGACTPDDELPATVVTGPRVLAIRAEPASVAPGQSTMVTALIVGAGPETPSLSWQRCRLAPRPGDAVNPDCVDTAEADYLERIGDGLTITASMPAEVTAADLGQPDASGGIYLPLVARGAAGAQELLAVYRLRLATGTDVNHNPALTGVLLVAADGSTTTLDEAAPPTVRAGDRLTLQAVVADGSAETYTPPLGTAPIAERVRTSWFSTAGRFSRERTEDEEPTTVLELRETLPPPGNAIDLWAVTRDERGGVAYVHRTLAFGQ